MTSLPIINSQEQLLPILKIWQQTLNPAVNRPIPPRIPFNLHAQGGASGATGVTLTWEVIRGADGYQVQVSPNGDFSTATTIATLSSPIATSWFDNTIITGVKRYYRVRATSGTKGQPQSVFGAWSAAVSNTSGSGNTTYDQTSSNFGGGGRTRAIK